MTGAGFDPRPIISRLRDGQGLDARDAGRIAAGLADGSVTDAQAAGFAMAVLLRGLSTDQRVALTLAMRDSGQVLRWDLPGPVLDKHSTGGIGDVTSLILAPLLAACGAYVPMISGRGLGHTGGTLDKLEAIPGWRATLSMAEFRDQVRKIGCAIVAASDELAPADRRLYAIRDEAACVESIDLITASILSKKLAEGLDGLVLDVKSGSGAFLDGAEAASALAASLVTTAEAAGCPTTALVTDMDQPLARAAGNAVEVRAAIDCLRGEPSALRDLTLALAAEALSLAGRADAMAEVTAALDSGRAAEIFARMIAAQGGPADLLDAPDRHLAQAPVIRAVPTPAGGFVASIDTRALGQAALSLGAGRQRAGEKIDHRTGLSDLLRTGEAADGPLAMVHAASEAQAERAIAAVHAAYRLTPDAPQRQPLILDRIASAGMAAAAPPG